jgi:hypothetical protein
VLKGLSMRNPLVRTIAIACLAGSAALAIAASASAAAPHPRIFLDSGTLTRLHARAHAGTSDWVALHNRCDEFLGGTVEWPDGNAYPDSGSIGAGYQGDGYLGPLLDVALCYEVTGRPAYAAKGIDVLTKMSAPSGAHAVDPLTDSGYGSRNYGVGLAIGYDWLHDKLTATDRSRIRAALVRWLSAYEDGGFEHDFPQGNYYAGYYAAKAYAALATEGDTSDPELSWTAWLNDIQRGFIQPYYAANLAGGGWPEGWNYGPLGTLNMTLPALAAKTAKGLDLPHLPGAPYAFPLTSPRYVMQFTWPDLRTLEDDGALYTGDNPSGIPSWFLPAESGFLEAMHAGFAPAFHSFATASRAAQGGRGGSDTDLWTNFLFWNPSAPTVDYRNQPRSYYARGMEAVAARSSWGSNATWLAFKSGPYINFPDAAHQYYDAGALSIVNGTRPFLVNAAAELLRNRKGTGSGDSYENAIYNDLFYADEPNRSIFNVFYVAHPTPRGQSSRLRQEGARTGIDRFEDGGRYVLARGVHLEDMYPQRSGNQTMRRWVREVLFVRPHLVAVFDTTQVTANAGDRWMAFHFGPRPSRTTAGSGGAVRFDVGKSGSYAGSVDVVEPTPRSFKIVDLFRDDPACTPKPSACGGKTYRLEIHGSETTKRQRWLTVFDSSSSANLAAKPAPLSHTAAVTGTLLKESGPDQAIASCTGDGTAVRYTVGRASTRHTIIDLPPNATYRLRERRSSTSDVIVLRRGAGDLHTSPEGVLTFTTGGAG